MAVCVHVCATASVMPSFRTHICVRLFVCQCISFLTGSLIDGVSGVTLCMHVFLSASLRAAQSTVESVTSIARYTCV